MAIVRYRPLSLIDELQREIFGRPSGSSGDLSTTATSDWSPAVDVKEENEQYVIVADIPGVDPKNIKVHMEEGVLTIEGEKQSESKEEDKNYTRVERFSGSFYRRFSLPDIADGDNISARCKHGVLEITIPKVAKKKTRSIDVKDEN